MRKQRGMRILAGDRGASIFGDEMTKGARLPGVGAYDVDRHHSIEAKSGKVRDPYMYIYIYIDR